MKTKEMIATLATNMKHAARNGETVAIGGGDFRPEELEAGAKALAAHDDLVQALQEARNEFTHHAQSTNCYSSCNEILTTIEAALAKAEGK